ncbi:MAG TPA: SDR family NAD(P)-dependent oxidoreductase [Cytophagaceae bacterium]|nr:SDR family NAD(P)-dependent oxidoreductase [Cytophagaceae bacterium]
MKKTILITGATGSVGKATAIKLAKENTQIVLLGRNAAKLSALRSEINRETGNNDIDILVADLADIASVKRAAQEFKQKYKRLDVLLNIAATYKNKREVSKDGLEMMFATNHMASFVLTTELLDLLKASAPSRVVAVAAPSFNKLNFDDLQGEKKFSALTLFGASKMANLLFTYALARKVQGTGVTTTVLHPGAVKSELTNDMPAFIKFIFWLLSSSADKPAKMLQQLSLAPEFASANGKFYKFDGKELKPSEYSSDKTVQDKLWQVSEELSNRVNV